MERIIDGEIYRLVRPGVYALYNDDGQERVRAWFVGEIIEDRRLQLKLTQKQLAARIGVSRSTLSRYEDGIYKKIPHEVMIRLADALDASVDYINGKVDDPHAVQFPETPAEAQERRLLQYFRRLSDDQKGAVVNMVEAIGGKDDAGI